MPKPIVDINKCENDFACVDACPVGVFEKKDDKLVIANPDDCIGCQACVGACPHGAIEIKD